MSFWAELRQRKVLRVAAVYLAVAWIATEVASVVLPTFGAPDWVLRVLILLFALGLPLVLLLTWALELTPGGVKVTPGRVGNKRIVAVAAGLAALALLWYFVGQPALRKQPAAVPERSIAVLPFVNMSGDSANDYFSDGLAETTLDMLAQVRDLKVIARTSSFAFKGENADMRVIGRKLGAAHLLEGSVQQAGDTVRITVQLIRAADGSHLWSKHFDRRMTDVFEVQDEIATAVVQALQVALPERTQKRLVQKRTDSVAAYREYLKGIALLPDRKVPEMREAARHFERAIQLDPGYARAYVAASDAYSLLDQYQTVSAEERRRSLDYVDRALALDPNLGEAHISKATDLENAGELDAAEAEYKRGLALAPGYATGYQWYAEFIATKHGDFDRALALFEKAVALDPLSPVIRDVHIFMLGQSGRVEQALSLIGGEIAAHPDIPRQYDTRSALHGLRGDLVAALRDMDMVARLDPDAIGFLAHRCHLLLDFSAVAEARDCIAPLARRAPDSNDVLGVRSRLAFDDGDLEETLRLVSRIQPTPEIPRAVLLANTGRAAEALEIFRRTVPGLFQQPAKVLPAQAFPALGAGVAMIGTGAGEQGRALLRQAIDAVAHRPYEALIAGRNWNEVEAHAQLGEPDRAFAAMRRAVAAGYFLDLAELDADPMVATLRTDPRYERILAPARARAAAQVEAARAQGLL